MKVTVFPLPRALGVILLGVILFPASGLPTEVKSSVPAAAASPAVLITRMLNDFLTNNSNPAQHQRFWATDLIYISSDGVVKSKAKIMESFAAGAKPPTAGAGAAAAYSAEDVIVRQYGDTAALTFRLVAQYPGGQRITYRNSGTLLHRNGSWQVVTWQSTRESKPVTH